jgi:hypothetical protein
MVLSTLFRRLTGLRPGHDRGVKSFEHELAAAGGVANRVDAGVAAVPVRRVVGSVDRWRVLRSDFLFRTGPRLTERHRSVEKAWRRGATLPPIELYTIRPTGPGAAPVGEYFVLDGHHRVAMARRMGLEFVDAHVVEYRVRSQRALGCTGVAAAAA